MKRILIFALLLIAAACSPKVYPTVVKDSVRVEIRERVLVDSVYLEVEKEVEKIVTRDTSSHLENKYGTSDAVVVDGFLFHSLETRPQRIAVPYEVTVRDTVTVEKAAETIVVKENYVTKWQSFSMIFGWICGGLLLAFLALLFVLKGLGL